MTQLDVSELEPPQPMHQITAALQTLATGEVLKVKHRRKPIPLFDMIAGRFEYLCCEVTPEHFQIYFWHLGDSQVNALVEKLCIEYPNQENNA